jgi:hypothetical protein
VNPYQVDQNLSDIFVTKLSPSGDSLIYSTYLGGDDRDESCGIAVDGSGCAYVAGLSMSTDFPTRHPYQTDQGSKDVIIVKIGASGDSRWYTVHILAGAIQIMDARSTSTQAVRLT